MTQRRIAIMSNSGGVGKTTLTVNLAYQLARLQKSVAVFGCDPNGSLTLFCGLEDPPNAKNTLDYVLRPEFEGNYPLFSVWQDHIEGIEACLGGLVLTDTAQRLVLSKRGEYLLADKLEDHPLSHDVIIFDCPGTIEQIHTVALAASTHLLLTLKPEDKDIDAVAKLLNWIYETRQALRLRPKPEILGVVPNGFKDRAMHRDNLGLSKIEGIESLPTILEKLNIPMFPVIKDNAYVANAAAAGLPLGIHRPGESINEIYHKIAIAVLESKWGEK